MPQLNPAPWFTTMIFSWSIFLVLVPMKILTYNFPNNLNPQTTKPRHTKPWSWPWL
nr:ATP synthase protein 8 [Pholidichthys leucotaenia]